jgi:hypothetical protein
MGNLPLYALLALLATLAAAGSAAAAEPPPMPDMSADMEIAVKGQPPQKGRVYSRDKKVRTEMDAGGHKMVSIMDMPGKKMWILMPPPMGCMAQPLQEDPSKPNPWGASSSHEEEVVGSETVDGHPTKKVKTTTTVDGKKHVMIQWRATDLGDFPIRMQSEDGSWETRYTNVKLAKPDAVLFEAPKDCKAGFDMKSMMPPPGARGR